MEFDRYPPSLVLLSLNRLCQELPHLRLLLFSVFISHPEVEGEVTETVNEVEVGALSLFLGSVLVAATVAAWVFVSILQLRSMD